jgi:(p)ppGpp synthase/HD superfamily hydrolase
MIFLALKYAAEAHSGHYRKATQIPYMVHLVGVMNQLLQAGYAEKVAVAGLLHDCIEDAGVSPEEIYATFGADVRDWVLATTEESKLPGEEKKPWKERKEKSLMALSAAKEEEILAITCADKLDNILSIQADLTKFGSRVWTRFNAPKEDQAWYYRRLLEIFRLKEDFTSVRFSYLSRGFAAAVQGVFPE